MAKQDEQPGIRWAWIARTLAVVLAIGYVATCGALYVLQEEMIFIGAGDRLPTLPPAPTGWETHRIEHEEGEGLAWYFRQPAPAPVVIMTHGNGESISHWPSAATPWIERGYSVLLPEYRGYAGLDGEPNMAKVTADMQAWRAWLDSQPDVKTDGYVYHGFSLGGGIVGQLTATHPPKVLVLQSTFTDITRLAPVPVPPFLVENEFDTLSVVSELDIPMVVIHGTEDQVIPVEHGRELAEATDANLVIYEGGHGPPADRSAMWAAIDKALAEAGSQPE